VVASMGATLLRLSPTTRPSVMVLVRGSAALTAGTTCTHTAAKGQQSWMGQSTDGRVVCM
jgi:hypothetical protein